MNNLPWILPLSTNTLNVLIGDKARHIDFLNARSEEFEKKIVDYLHQCFWQGKYKIIVILLLLLIIIIIIIFSQSVSLSP